MKKWIWFDMDGTLADFYGVEGWLEYLKARKTTPYETCDLLYKYTDMMELFAYLKRRNYNIGVISWGSKQASTRYLKAIAKAKTEWLKKFHFDEFLDEVIIAPYGTCKATVCRGYGAGVLVDDEEKNRKDWDLGFSVDATKNILDILYEMA